ncbi:MAG: hypothetical protein R2882_12790 [Gemmatimonadales bacterium]
MGAKKIGSALVQYRGFQQRGFDVAIYDTDPTKVGKSWNGLTVRSAATSEQTLADLKPDIAVIVTPGEAAQAIADQVVSALLSRPSSTSPPGPAPGAGSRVSVKTVNLVLELEALSFALGCK